MEWFLFQHLKLKMSEEIIGKVLIIDGFLYYNHSRYVVNNQT